MVFLVHPFIEYAQDDDREAIDSTLLGKPETQFKITHSYLIEFFNEHDPTTKGYAKPEQK